MALTEGKLPDWRDALPWPGRDTHKHMRGRLGVVSGPATRTGAARLAARAGLRIGAGVVRILCPPDAAPVIAAAIEAVMLSSFGSADALTELVEGMDAVVIGPAAGITDATRAHVRAVAATGAAMVVDADGLTVFDAYGQWLFRGRAAPERLASKVIVILHEGSAGRDADIEAIRLAWKAETGHQSVLWVKQAAFVSF